MEPLKTKFTVDTKFIPSLNLGYLDYFSRAMAFAQTNYADELDKRRKASFGRITAITFFEEYVWSVACQQQDVKIASTWFPQILNHLVPYTKSFWDLNNFPKNDEAKNDILSIMPDEEKYTAIVGCASILNKGIKLFEWDYYRRNFLNAPEKLCVLPMIGIESSQQLARNIGQDIVGNRLQSLATHWKFNNSRELCTAINKNIAMKLNVIELVLWYTAATFETNITEA